MSQDLLVGEAEDGPSHGFQLRLTEVVPENDLVQPMDPAIDLKDQPQPIAGEIGEEAADRMLSAKPVAVDPAVPNASPEAAFRQARALALSARKSCAATGHSAT